MTLHATNKIENIKASIEKYIYDNLVTIESLNIDWQGGKGIDKDRINEWVQPTLLKTAKFFRGDVTSTEKGNEAEFMINFNIFVRKASTNNFNRLFELRDIVANYFKDNQQIVLRDYTDAGKPHSETMIVKDIITDSEIPSMDDTLFQYNFSPLVKTIMRY